MMIVLLQGNPDAGGTARAHVFRKMQSLVHYPSWTMLQQTKYFCIQALCKSQNVPQHARKRHPLDALNSIVSACPRDFRHKRVGPAFTTQVPGASRNWLPPVEKAQFVAGGYGGATLRHGIYGATVGQRDHTSRVCRSPDRRIGLSLPALSSWR